MASEALQGNLAVQENIAETEMASEAVQENIAEMAAKLPQFIVIDSARKSLSYIREGGEMDGCIKSLETATVNPYAKFEVEKSSNNDGYVHIRSCQNNKYLERINIPNSQHWIAATAEKKEEDQSKDSCTLFQFFDENGGGIRFKIWHVQSGRYWSTLFTPGAPFNSCVVAEDSHVPYYSYTIHDWSSCMILPRFVAFKGNNNQYVRRHLDGGVPYLQFSSSDIGDREVALEIIPTLDGCVYVKQLSSGKLWSTRNSHWVWADEGDNGGTPSADTWFLPLHINDDTIGLFQVRKKKYAKRLTADKKNNCLNAQLDHLTAEAWLKVEEPVTRREIKDVEYDLANARIYGETAVVAGETSLANPTPQEATLSSQIRVKDKKITTWKAHLSLRLGVKATARAGIPIIADAKVSLSAEINAAIEWEKTEEKTAEKIDTVTVPVPPMSIAKVEAVATQGRCDVPFTYIQKDTLYDGRIVETIHHGTFTGANYYNTQFKYTYEPHN